MPVVLSRRTPTSMVEPVEPGKYPAEEVTKRPGEAHPDLPGQLLEAGLEYGRLVADIKLGSGRLVEARLERQQDRIESGCGHLALTPRLAGIVGLLGGYRHQPVDLRHGDAQLLHGLVGATDRLTQQVAHHRGLATLGIKPGQQSGRLGDLRGKLHDLLVGQSERRRDIGECRL